MIFLGILAIVVAGGLIQNLFLYRVESQVDPKEPYPVKGVDVSEHQKDIDWKGLASEDISFAFIKATEGSGFTDRMFAANWEGAKRAGLRVGAYHFFSFDSGGDTQADRFIAEVEKTEEMLPPVVDVEFYGDKEAHPPAKEDVQRELGVLLARLEEAYGAKPILYATGKSYERYLKYAYPENPIWIRNIVSEPRLPDGRDWTFWQYTDRARLPGYQGEERFIDLNVFAGSEEAFMAFGL